MIPNDLYRVAGRDLRQVVERCLEVLKDSERSGMGAAVEAETNPVDKAFYGRTLVMSYIAPRTWGDSGSEDELLLFAVLAVFDKAPTTAWEGAQRHIEKALTYMQSIGEAEGARRLCADLAAQAIPDEATEIMREWISNGSLGGDPGRIAEHERNLAQDTLRGFRAARALDPSAVDPWDLIPGG